MSEKKCFSVIHCTLRSRCEAAYRPYTNGYFAPREVDENCDSFKQLDDDLVEKLQRMAGSHE